jgi:redox-sensitive bicupin YhaK (pirin superfamily)
MCGAELHSVKNIKAVVPMPYHAFDAQSGAHMLRAQANWLDPFIGVDSFVMPQPFFGPHPHAGMSAVTLMLPEAEGGFINRDSLGDSSTIRPGDLHWTQAGRGMMHEEVPSEPGKAAHGLQIFVNLARANKQAAPAAFHINHENMPVVTMPDAQVRVVAGEFAGHSSPIAQDSRWLTRVNLLDVSLQADAVLNVPVKAGDNAFFVLYSGMLALPDLIQNRPLAGVESERAAIIFEADGVVAQLKAGSAPVRGVFFSGTPLNEPLVSGGPFMGNTADDITHYKRAFARGDMGQLSKSF